MEWWFMKTILRNERGLTLAIVLMMMVVLLSITGAGLLFSNLNLKASANLKGGTVALQAADAGIQHALAATPAGGDFDSFWTGTGLANFPCKNSSGTTGTCNGTTYKPTLTGSINGYSYTVVVENDTTVVNETATGDVNKIVIFTSTATSPSGSNRRVKAYIGRSTWAPPGTLYLPGAYTNISETFNGNAFAITGNDTNSNGTAGSSASILGIATNNAATTTEIKGTGGTLSSSQYGQVTGLGSNPSVATSTSTLDVYQLAENLIALGGSDLQTYDGGRTYKSTHSDLGTSSSPKITHITADTGRNPQATTLICGSGNTSGANGYGVLIVDGDLEIRGLFRFQGLIIARGGNIDISGAGGGGATVWGAVLVNTPAPSVALTIAGNMYLRYSSTVLNTYVNRWASAFSTNARIIAWNEMM
jgi:Tfp pilus assembly protein PilX